MSLPYSSAPISGWLRRPESALQNLQSERVWDESKVTADCGEVFGGVIVARFAYHPIPARQEARRSLSRML